MICTHHTQPNLNTQVYDVEFPDGSIEQYSANVIAQNILSQVDEVGFRYQLLDAIVDHRRTKDFILLDGEDKYKKKSTKGWYLLVKGKDGSEAWKPPKVLKGMLSDSFCYIC